MDQFLDKYVFPYTGKYFGWAKKTKDGLPVYTQREELFNMISHIIGIFIGLGVITVSIFNYHSEMGMIGGIIFGFSLIVLYLASSIYHGTSVTNAAEKKIYRLMDHCSIFILIAGTCSPFILSQIAKTSDQTEWIFYALIWLFAATGITLLCINMKKFKSITIVMYVIMGGLLAFRADELAGTIGNTGIFLLLTGGVIYLIGLLFYGLGSKKEWMHSVFHVLCLVGSVFHCICIYNYVI